MPLQFIDIHRKSRNYRDKSSLALDSLRATPGFIQVIGGLEHCVEIAPANEAARLALIRWLESDECKAVAKGEKQ